MPALKNEVARLYIVRDGRNGDCATPRIQLKLLARFSSLDEPDTDVFSRFVTDAAPGRLCLVLTDRATSTLVRRMKQHVPAGMEMIIAAAIEMTNFDTLHELSAAGVSIFLDAPLDAAQLAEAVGDPFSFGVIVSRRIVRNWSEPNFATIDTVADQSLTPREREIVNFVSAGLTSKSIAEHLNVSIRTVEAHRFNILRKFRRSANGSPSLHHDLGPE